MSGERNPWDNVISWPTANGRKKEMENGAHEIFGRRNDVVQPIQVTKTAKKILRWK